MDNLHVLVYLLLFMLWTYSVYYYTSKVVITIRSNIFIEVIIKYYLKIKYYFISRYGNHKFICPKCCCTQPSLLRSINIKKCTSCGHEIDWQLSEGQLPLIRSNRMVKRK